MKFRVGQTFYWCTIDEDTGKCLIEEVVVRTIRAGYVHAIWKNSLTWGKRSKTHGDFGWLRNIPAWCRHKWNAEDGKRPLIDPYLKNTKLAAIRYALADVLPANFKSPEAFAKAQKTLRGMESRHRRKPKAREGD